MTKQTEALKLALEALLSTYPTSADQYARERAAITALREALAEQPAQQEPADKKYLSDYILVGSLSLAGIEDGEYGQSEIDSFENTIEALQEKLVTGVDHKKVPLLAYVGALNSTSPPAQRTWVGLTDDERLQIYLKSNGIEFYKNFAMNIEAKLKEKNQ